MSIPLPAFDWQFRQPGPKYSNSTLASNMGVFGLPNPGKATKTSDCGSILPWTTPERTTRYIPPLHQNHEPEDSGSCTGRVLGDRGLVDGQRNTSLHRHGARS